MTNEYYSSLQLFYDLFSVELVERKIECLDTASIVSRQLSSAGIKHRVICGSAHVLLSNSEIVLAPHYYAEAEIGDTLTLIDPSLAFWLEDEIADGAFIPFVFRGYEGARAHNVDYLPVESVELCEIVCGDLIDLIKQHPLPLSCFF